MTVIKNYSSSKLFFTPHPTPQNKSKIICYIGGKHVILQMKSTTIGSYQFDWDTHQITLKNREYFSCQWRATVFGQL